MRTEMLAPDIEQAVRAVQDASSVVSQLVDDSSLACRLAATLTLDTCTGAIAPGYLAVSTPEHVMVAGAIAEEACVAVSQVCSSIVGVRSAKIRSTGNSSY
jgi:hypothetical protein